MMRDRIFGDRSVFLTLAVTLAAAKALVFFLLIHLKVLTSPAGSVANALRLRTLDTNFFEYFLRYIEKPPLSIILDAALVKIFGVESIVSSPLPCVVTSVLSISAALLVYLTARLFQAPAWPAAIIAFLFGFGLTPFDYWAAGAHYDHYTIPLAALFVFVSSRFVLAPSWKSALWLGATAAIYTSQSSVTSAVAPTSIVLCGIVLWSLGAEPLRRLAPKIVAAVCMPLVMVGAISFKNAAWSGVATPASNGGAANMMLAWVVSSAGGDSSLIDRAINAVGAPEWYRWCWNNPGTLIDKATGLPHPGWEFMARTHGFCFQLNSPDQSSWPTDFAPLIAHLQQHPASADMLRSVEQQAEIARNRPYLFAGYNPENTMPWIAAYGSISSRVLQELIRSHPFYYLSAIRTNARMMFETGPTGLSGLMLRQGRTIPRTGTLAQTIGRFTDLWGQLFRLGMLSAVLMAIVAGLSVARTMAVIVRDRSRQAASPAWVQLNLQMTAALAAPGLLIMAVFILVSFGEFERLAIQASPALFAMLATLPLLIKELSIWVRPRDAITGEPVRWGVLIAAPAIERAAWEPYRLVLLWLAGAAGFLASVPRHPYDVIVLVIAALFVAGGMALRPVLLLMAGIVVAVGLTYSFLYGSQPGTVSVISLASVGIFAIGAFTWPSALIPLGMLLALINLDYTTSAHALLDNQVIFRWIRTSWFLAASAMFFAAVICTNTEKRTDAVAYGLITAGVLAALIGFAGYLTGGEGFQLGHRARGFFNDPNMFSAFLVAASLLVWSYMSAGVFRRSVGISLLLLLAVVFVLSWSRLGWMQLLLAWGLLGVLVFASRLTVDDRRILNFTVGGGLVLMFIALWAGVLPEGLRQNGALRALTALLSFNFPVGIGPLQAGPDIPQSAFLTPFIAGGWISGWSYLVLAVLTVVLGWRALLNSPWRPTMAAIYCAYVSCQVQGLISDIGHWRHSYLLLGVLWGLIATRPKNVAAPRPMAA
jgi:hypothetical protein